MRSILPIILRVILAKQLFSEKIDIQDLNALEIQIKMLQKVGVKSRHTKIMQALGMVSKTRK